jgi:TadE-like protein
MGGLLIRTRRWLIKFAGRTEGAEIAEAALVLPLVFMLLLGIYWFGRAYNIYSTATQAANAGASVAAKPLCAICTGAATWPGTSFPDDATVVAAVTQSLQASKLDPGQIAAYTLAPAPTACANVAPAGVCKLDASNITICRNVQLNAGSTGPQQCGAIVSFHYPYQFYFPFTSLNFQLVNLPAAAETSMEY